MAGHSHWANIAYKKAAVDKRRGKLWSKLARQVLTAAKLGGGNPDANNRLKLAIQAARAANMSNDQIKRIVDRATGAGASEEYEEALYEGYAPGGCAVLVEALTDNRHRTAGDVRNIFEKNGGNLASAGAVAWQFDRRGVVRVAKGGASEDDVMSAVLDAGADDVEDAGDEYVVSGAPQTLAQLQQAAQSGGLSVQSAQITYVPKDWVPVDPGMAPRVSALLEALEENDDVQHVHVNAEFPEGFQG
jgi:YebC/PmpR family DNA-binding regulatory protein